MKKWSNEIRDFWDVFCRKHWRGKIPQIGVLDAIELIASVHAAYREEMHVEMSQPNFGSAPDAKCQFSLIDATYPIFWSWGFLFATRYYEKNCPEFEKMSELLENFQIDGDKDVVYLVQEVLLGCVVSYARPRDPKEQIVYELGRISRRFASSLS